MNILPHENESKPATVEILKIPKIFETEISILKNLKDKYERGSLRRNFYSELSSYRKILVKERKKDLQSKLFNILQPVCQFSRGFLIINHFCR
jgi:hypothetical protein